MFANEQKRGQWVTATLTVRTANANKTMRTLFEDGTPVQFYFTAKGEKSAVSVQHEKLADKETAERMKQWWGERLDALAALPFAT